MSMPALSQPTAAGYLIVMSLLPLLHSSVPGSGRYARLPAGGIVIGLATDAALGTGDLRWSGMRLSLPRSLAGRPAVLDAAVAIVLAGLSAYLVWSAVFPTTHKLGQIYGWAPQTLHWHVIGWFAATAAELAVLPLRRRLPVPVLVVTLTMAIVHGVLLPVGTAPADLAVAIAVYSVASTMPRLMSGGVVVACGLLAAGLDALLVDVSGGQRKLLAEWILKPSDLIVPAVVLAAAWIAGDGARTRRAYTAAVERRALDAERDRDLQAGLAAAAERERITRELHDVIAHAISVMVIQAQGAGSALRLRQEGQAREALDAIVTTGRGALSETRRVLGVVRRPDDAEPDLAPQPALRDLPSLAARVRHAGTPVQLAVTGEARPLPGGIELSAYRIVQEALTNTMKHAGPAARATVSVHYAKAELLVDITDDGNTYAERPVVSPLSRADAAGEDGHGLTGMRARVAMLGGELSASPVPGAGFRVRARLPVPVPVPATVDRP
jgi:signal transduction histidine kinase